MKLFFLTQIAFAIVTGIITYLRGNGWFTGIILGSLLGLIGLAIGCAIDDITETDNDINNSMS